MNLQVKRDRWLLWFFSGSLLAGALGFIFKWSILLVIGSIGLGLIAWWGLYLVLNLYWLYSKRALSHLHVNLRTHFLSCTLCRH